MKRLKTIILSLLSVTTLLAQNAVPTASSEARTVDSTDISLLTCTPGTEVWAQYGHTAIRIRNRLTGVDMVVNYGMFSSHQPYFIPRFILGLTDYRVEAIPFEAFLEEYAYEGRGVTEQTLNIAAADKEKILLALQNNLQPENKTYRYNFFYDNCTTRARDIIVKNLSDTVVYPGKQAFPKTYRANIHRWNDPYPWAQFGEDMLLGLKADKDLTQTERQFLPKNLMDDFERTLYKGKPLVASTQMILPAKNSPAEKEFPLSPMDFIIMIFVVVITFELVEYKKRTIFWGVDLFLMLLSGIPGVILFVMIFSQHPTVSLNLLILLANPLALIFAIPAVRHTMQRRKYWWWTAWEIMTVAGMIGGLFQSYPKGIIILALLLLSRPMLHHYWERQLSSQSPEKTPRA